MDLSHALHCETDFSGFVLQHKHYKHNDLPGSGMLLSEVYANKHTEQLLSLETFAFNTPAHALHSVAKQAFTNYFLFPALKRKRKFLMLHNLFEHADINCSAASMIWNELNKRLVHIRVDPVSNCALVTFAYRMPLAHI